MKKLASNKQDLKEEVKKLISPTKKTELRSIELILSFSGRFKIDRYTYHLGTEYDERRNFSMPEITEEEAKRALENPDVLLIIFKEEGSIIPKWQKRSTNFAEVVANGSNLETVRSFFNYDYASLIFPKTQMPSGADYFRWIRTDPRSIWESSSERLLWKKVTEIWERVILRKDIKI